MPRPKGEQCYQWKGDKAGYVAIHKWVIRNKPCDGKCEMCGEYKKLDAANISQKYYRSINDFEWLCRKCHMKKDRRHNFRKGILREKKICSKNGCNNKSRCLKMCQKHYDATRNYILERLKRKMLLC